MNFVYEPISLTISKSGCILEILIWPIPSPDILNLDFDFEI